MRNDKHLAIQFRKQEKSYNKISKELDIPKSTLSDWLSNFKWSSVIKEELTRKASYIAKKRLRIYNKRRKILWEQWREKARQEAKDNFSVLKNSNLFLAGLMLYWSEGDGKIENGQVRLANTDPEMIRIFVKFLHHVCRVSLEKIRVYIILYPDLNENKCKEFWSRASEVPRNQFSKTQYIYGKHPTRRLNYGICQIHTASRQLKEKIFVWIKLYQKEFMRA